MGGCVGIAVSVGVSVPRRARFFGAMSRARGLCFDEGGVMVPFRG